MGSHDLTVVMTTCRNPQLLHDALATMLAYVKGPYRVLVADMAEEEEDQRRVDRVVGSDDRVRAVHFGENLISHTRATSRLMSQIDTPFVAEIHDDVVFHPGAEDFWLRMLEVASDARVGTVGCCCNGGEGFSNPLRTDLPLRVETHTQHYPCLLYRKDFYRDVGGYDDDLFRAHIMDLCIRGTDKGYLHIIDRGCYLHHVGGATFSQTYADRAAFGEAIARWGEMTYKELVAKHGMARIYEYLAQAHDRESVLACAAGWVALEEGLHRRPRPYRPPGRPLLGPKSYAALCQEVLAL